MKNSKPGNYPICNILGININNLKKQEINRVIVDFLASGKPHLVTTPNPEIVLKAIKDEEYFNIINNSDLAIPDGIGLKFASWLLGANLERYTGVDLTRFLLELAQKKQYKVAVLNLKNGLSKDEEIRAYLNKNYPQLRFVVLPVEKNQDNTVFFNDFKPNIVLSNQGNPFQEKYLGKNLLDWPFCRVAAGIGGAFDNLLNKVRVPAFFKAIGLEWLWRGLSLFKYTNRAKRIKRLYNATFVFVYKFLVWRLVLPFFYRPNVACLFFKEESQKKEFLIVERADEPGHWQLPQGGLGSLGIKEAAAKELEEELGTDKFEIVKTAGFIHKYRFPADLPRHRGAQYQKHTGYKGQKQALAIARFRGKDQDIRINNWDHRGWKWVSRAGLLDAVHPVRRPGYAKMLAIFDNNY